MRLVTYRAAYYLHPCMTRKRLAAFEPFIPSPCLSIILCHFFIECLISLVKTIEHRDRLRSRIIIIMIIKKEKQKNVFPAPVAMSHFARVLVVLGRFPMSRVKVHDSTEFVLRTPSTATVDILQKASKPVGKSTAIASSLLCRV